MVVYTNEKEFARQIVHFSGVVVIPFAIFDQLLTAYGALLISLGILIASEYVKNKERLRNKLPVRIHTIEKIEDSIHNAINSLEREEVIQKQPYLGAFTFYFSAGIVFLIFPLIPAVLGITVLAVGDSVSTLVGIHYGRHKLPIDPKKSWEGSLAGFFSALLACYLVSFLITIPLTYVIIAPLIGMTVEAVSLKFNDNLMIPISIGVILLVI